MTVSRAVDGEGDVEGGLHGGLVEGGEGAAGVGGFELGYGVVAGLGFGEVKAAELVVEDAGIADVEGDRTGGELVRKDEGGLLPGGVERDGRGLGVAGVGVRRGSGHGEKSDLGGVEGDGIAGVLEGEIDGFFAGKGGGGEVGREVEGVVPRQGTGREALRGERRDEESGSGEKECGGGEAAKTHTPQITCFYRAGRRGTVPR